MMRCLVLVGSLLVAGCVQPEGSAPPAASVQETCALPLGWAELVPHEAAVYVNWSAEQFRGFGLAMSRGQEADNTALGPFALELFDELAGRAVMIDNMTYRMVIHHFGTTCGYDHGFTLSRATGAPRVAPLPIMWAMANASTEGYPLHVDDAWLEMLEPMVGVPVLIDGNVFALYRYGQDIVA